MHESLRAQRVVLGPLNSSMPPIEVFVGPNRPRPRPVITHTAATPDGTEAPRKKPAAAKPAATKSAAKKPHTEAPAPGGKPQPRPGS